MHKPENFLLIGNRREDRGGFDRGREWDGPPIRGRRGGRGGGRGRGRGGYGGEGRTIGENAVMNGAEIATSETVMRKTSLVVVAGVGAGAVGDAAMEGMAIGSMAEVLVGMVVPVHRDPRGLRDLQGRQVLWAMVVDRLRRIHSHLLLPHQ